MQIHQSTVYSGYNYFEGIKFMFVVFADQALTANFIPHEFNIAIPRKHHSAKNIPAIQWVIFLGIRLTSSNKVMSNFV